MGNRPDAIEMVAATSLWEKAKCATSGVAFKHSQPSDRTNNAALIFNASDRGAFSVCFSCKHKMLAHAIQSNGFPIRIMD